MAAHAAPGLRGGGDWGIAQSHAPPCAAGAQPARLTLGGISCFVLTRGMVLVWIAVALGAARAGTTTVRTTLQYAGRFIGTGSATSPESASNGPRVGCAPSQRCGIVAWGDANYGGDAAYAPNASEPGVTQVLGSEQSFAAVLADGALISFGKVRFQPLEQPPAGGTAAALAATSHAFAAIDAATGATRVWGAAGYGAATANTTGTVAVPAAVTSPMAGRGMAEVVGNDNAFCAIVESVHTLLCWGNKAAGGGGPGAGVQGSRRALRIVAGYRSFAALFDDGTVVQWGQTSTLVPIPASVTAPTSDCGVTAIAATKRAFAALVCGGAIATWGLSSDGALGPAEGAGTGFVTLYAANQAFVAVRADGSAVTWGAQDPATPAAIASSPPADGCAILSVTTSTNAFTAMLSGGGVVSWGSATEIANFPEALGPGGGTRVKHVAATQGAFAAIDNNGKLWAWGKALYGGRLDPSLEATRATVLAANYYAFAGITTAGAAVSWGFDSYGGTVTEAAASPPSGTRVIAIVGNFYSFVALTSLADEASCDVTVVGTAEGRFEPASASVKVGDAVCFELGPGQNVIGTRGPNCDTRRPSVAARRPLPPVR